MNITAPAIGKLLNHPRMWAWRRVVDGTFGPIVERRGRALLVDLKKVEDHAGISFTNQQIIDAVAGIQREIA
jgi:hypothetical protein